MWSNTYDSSIAKQPAAIRACRDDAGEVLGYLVFRTVRLKGLSAGMILDLLVDPSPPGLGAGRGLVAAATQTLRQAGATVAVCRLLDHTDEYRVLRQEGYLPCPARFDPWPITVAGRPFSEEVAVDELGDLGSWFYSLGDWGVDAFSA